MELIEKLQKIIEREIDNVPMVLTDPLTLRRLRAERLAQAALTALIEHAGQDGVTEVSTQDALDFIGTAMRNWRHVVVAKEELEDFRVSLQLRDARHRATAFAAAFADGFTAALQGAEAAIWRIEDDAFLYENVSKALQEVISELQAMEQNWTGRVTIEHRQAAIKQRDAQIVAWLREDADTLEREDTAWNAAYLAEAIRECADAIERGDV